MRVELRTKGEATCEILSDIWRLFFGVVQIEEDKDGDLFVEATLDPDSLHVSGSDDHFSIISEIASDTVKTSVFEVRFDESGIEYFVNRYEREASMEPEGGRRIARRELYRALSELTGIKFPWGALTGVRPTQIAAFERERVHSDQAAIERLVDRWQVSREKATLAIKTNNKEQAILNALPPDAYAIYVGIPFCPSRCLYCSFTSRDAGRDPRLLGLYGDALQREIAKTLDAGTARFGTLVSLYIGGGTPTTLEDDDFERLLDQLIGYTGNEIEITVEAGRPETISEEKLRILEDCGITRLSINPQTMRDETLPRLNRRHSVSDVFQAFARAREYGMREINMDLIAGLAGETPEDFLYSVDTLIALNPEKISLHGLAKKRGSALKESTQKMIFWPDPRWTEAYLKAEERLEQHGYYPYYLYRQKYIHSGLENVSFAKPGKETIYNVAMMSDRVHVLGFGAGSTTKFIVDTKAKRLHTPKDVKMYIENAESYGQRKVQRASELLAFFDRQ